ncbi:YjdF family protein [Acetivibrio cellulolyticus]|uniref:YjdF family protein n=1 Tax=Acetivibrio cellulolyticus TaxID=35830 RepID=UPI0001E301D5|nr:YjdF family protein [Acetivibrio cellulolyticus]
MNAKLTVYFDDPFWVEVFERFDEGLLETSRVVFGAEPKDYEVYAFILENYYKLRFSRPIRVDFESGKRINPKRLQRKVRKETSDSGIGTKAQQAIKLEHEARKQEQKKTSKEKREELEQLKFEKRQEKRRKRKRGININ